MGLRWYGDNGGLAYHKGPIKKYFNSCKLAYVNSNTGDTDDTFRVSSLSTM